MFLKYPKLGKGKPQKRIVAVDDTLTKVVWKDLEKQKIEGFLLINDIIGTKKGHTSKKLVKCKSFYVFSSFMVFCNSFLFCSC